MVRGIPVVLYVFNIPGLMLRGTSEGAEKSPRRAQIGHVTDVGLPGQPRDLHSEIRNYGITVFRRTRNNDFQNAHPILQYLQYCPVFVFKYATSSRSSSVPSPQPADNSPSPFRALLASLSAVHSSEA